MTPHQPAPLPARPRDGHKGTFGTVGVVGGSAGRTRMIGAPALAALAALRAGAGLVRVGAPAPIVDSVLVAAPGATGIAIPAGADGAIEPHAAAAGVDDTARDAECLAIGPGLGRGPGAQAATLRALSQEECPVVVDADALNAMCEIPDITRDLRAAAVLTPHPGEYARLARALALPTAGPRAGMCESLARRLGCVVVLKGAGTVVSDGRRTWAADDAEPVLATAGTGDVLTGVIAGLVAQWVRAVPGAGRLDLLDAACLAVRAHALGAHRWSARTGATGGMLATDLLAELPGALESLRAGPEPITAPGAATPTRPAG